MRDVRTEVGPITEEMVRRLNAGEMDAFNDIYHATYIYLCCLSMYYVHNRQEASSVVNDVFYAFWERRGEIHYPPLPWLRTAVRNASISYLRSSLFKETVATVREEKAWDFLENHLFAPENPLEELENKELRKKVLLVVESLPPRCREVFKQCLFEGKSYTETAHDLGISPSTARVHLKHAVDRLRQELDGPLFVLLMLYLW
ncbi:MAG: RNA polymerase sigma-70 factor [Bacteroidales bacterium]|nr:RNA polymerase sigma-70 factor [Bacteroidales bacterium]